MDKRHELHDKEPLHLNKTTTTLQTSGASSTQPSRFPLLQLYSPISISQPLVNSSTQQHTVRGGRKPNPVLDHVAPSKLPRLMPNPPILDIYVDLITSSAYPSVGSPLSSTRLPSLLRTVLLELSPERPSPHTPKIPLSALARRPPWPLPSSPHSFPRTKSARKSALELISDRRANCGLGLHGCLFLFNPQLSQGSADIEAAQARWTVNTSRAQAAAKKQNKHTHIYMYTWGSPPAPRPPCHHHGGIPTRRPWTLLVGSDKPHQSLGSTAIGVRCREFRANDTTSSPDGTGFRTRWTRGAPQPPS